MLKGLLPNIGSHASTSEYMPMTRDGKSTHLSNQVKPLVIRLVPTVFIFALGIVIGTCYPSYLSIYTRKPQQISSLLPVTLPPLPDSVVPPVPSLPAPNEPIPNVVHYVYGLDTGPQPDFPYFAYLAMRSAMTVLKPERIYFHCIREPQGHWWSRVRNWEGWIDQDGTRKGLVEVVRAREVEWVGKTRRPAHHYAHKADIIRLEVLLQYGGIYLDIDTFILRSFESASLLAYDTVLGMEARGLNFLRGYKSDMEMDPKGLCNAVIVSRPNAIFIKRWLESYDSFDESEWTGHSIEMPWNLAKLYPTTVTVLSDRTFFWPLWTSDHITAVYASKEYDFEASGQLAYHAWESKARPYLSVLDPSTIQTIDTSFTRMASRFREPGEERRWRAALEAEEAQREGLLSGDGMGDERRERLGYWKLSREYES